MRQNEERVQDLGGLRLWIAAGGCRASAVRRIGRVLFEQEVALLFPCLARIGAPLAREAIDEQLHLIRGRRLVRVLVVPEQVIPAELQTGQSRPR